MDINNFGPFHPDIWGTFSDWMMVLVTAITAIYLILTFRSQKEVQKLQQETTRIEQYWHRDKLKPSFELTTSFQSDDSTKEEHSICIKFCIKTINNLAKNVTINFPNSGRWRMSIKPINNGNKKPNDEINFYGVFTQSKLGPLQAMYIANLNLEIQYDDADNNHYKLNLNYTNVNGAAHVSHNLPELRKNRI